MLLAKNRKALYNYEIIEKFMGGLLLKGYEVKAVREGKVNMEGSFIKFEDGELVVTNMHIGKYSKQSQNYVDEDSRLPKKILVTKPELAKISKALQEKGKTAVPLALVLRNNLIKLEFAVVKGKKKEEKKQVAKERQIKRDLDIQVKNLKNRSF